MGFHFQNYKHFLEYFGSTYWLESKRKKYTRNFCLFVSLQSYDDKGKFSFLQRMQSSHNKSYLQTSHFCAKCYYCLLALTFFYTLKDIPWKNYARFWKWNLKRTPQSRKNSFSRKSNLKFCIVFNLISFANAQSSVKIKLACSKVSILITLIADSEILL